MTTRMDIRESETGLVRIFAVDLSPAEARAVLPDDLADLLGQTKIDMDHVEIFDTADLAGFGFEAYLAEGHGIPDAELAAHRWQLDALDGAALILRSSAILVRPTTLSPKPPLRWIATFGEDRSPVPLTPLAAESAKGTLGAQAPTTAPRGSLWVLLAGGLLLAALALTLILAT